MAEVLRSMKDGFEIRIAVTQNDLRDRRFAEETGARIAERARMLTERNRLVSPAPLPNPFSRN